MDQTVAAPSSPQPATAWVTGGSSGIGRAVVDHLVGSGARVAVLDVVVPERSDVTYLPCDLADSARVGDAMAALWETVGPPDALVLSAAVTAGQPVEGHDEAAWRRVLEVNLTASMLGMSAVLGHP